MGFMKSNDINDLKKLTLEIINDEKSDLIQKKNQNLINKIYGEDDLSEKMNTLLTVPHKKNENLKNSKLTNIVTARLTVYEIYLLVK